MASTTLRLTVVKRPAGVPVLPAFAVAANAMRHSTASALGNLLQAGGVATQPAGPQPLAVLTAQKPWVKDKADLTVYNAVFNIAGGPVPTIVLTPSSASHLGSVQVYVRNTSAGKMFVIEFLGHSQTGNDFEVQLGPTLEIAAGDFKLPIAITSSGATGYCRISAKNYGQPTASMAMAVRIDSIKVWAVN
jgi:hypothetical protein